MPAAIAEIEAVRVALGAYLLAQLSAQFPALKVLNEWPAANVVLPEFAISLLTTDEAEIEPHAPTVMSSVVGSGNNGTVTYAYAYASGIQLEMDCWAATKPKRDLLQLAVRQAMSRPPQKTITGADDGRPILAHRSYITLAVPGIYGALFNYRFKPVPTVDESSEKSERNEFRSHWRGTADGPLLEQDTIALIKRMHISGQLGPGAPGPGGFKQTITEQRPGSQSATMVAPNNGKLGVGQTLQLKAYALATGGDVVDVTATAAWLSSDPTKATVSSTGLVTRVAAGAASITATSGGFVGACSVTTV